jgi:hypothetical protein
VFKKVMNAPYITLPQASFVSSRLQELFGHLLIQIDERQPPPLEPPFEIVQNP